MASKDNVHAARLQDSIDLGKVGGVHPKQLVRKGHDPGRLCAVHRREVLRHKVQHGRNAARNVRLRIKREVVHEPLVEAVVQRRAGVGVGRDAAVARLVLEKVSAGLAARR